ncbi:complement factor B-like isoform X1 [Hypanus sabinus]|uniref:complement factor B-like isoform X1 n=2 Tax=Hypanus sabinus TaxID=79690 RepID=UPI0028C3DF31|nr:complement factor B-like isoform X1 [Hypanus sabinus]
MNALYLGLGLGLALLLTSKGEEVVTCDPNIHITGGWVIKSKGNNVTSVATFQCPDWHYPWPMSTSKCLHSGRWRSYNEGMFICKALECPAPVLEDGIVYPGNLTFVHGETVSFDCYDGYILKGSQKRTCMKNGRWNGTNAVCTTGLQECSHPGIPAGGRKAGTRYNIGDKVQYDCNSGLVLVGSTVRECLESGDWSGMAPMCLHPNSFDTPEEVAESFSASLTSTLGISRSDPSKSSDRSTARKLTISKDAHLHVYFMIDASRSVEETNFKLAMDMVENLIEKISSFDVRPRFGVVTYASNPIRVVNLNERERSGSEDVLQILKTEESAKYAAHKDQRGTNIHAALIKVYEMMLFSKQQFKDTWKDIRFATILFTDGRKNMGPEPHLAAEKIKKFVEDQGKSEDYLDMYAFGISDQVDMVELSKLASKKSGERHSFNVKNISVLVQSFDEILDFTTLGNLCGVADENPQATFRKRHPWHVNIEIPQIDIQDNSPHSATCSGSIVAPKWILTAAHCFIKIESRMSTQRIQVVFGENQLARVSELHVHPQFSIAAKVNKSISQFYDYDVALIELDKPLTYSPDVRSICLPCTPETTRALRKPHPKTKCIDHERLLLPTDKQVHASFVKRNRASTRKETQGHVTIKTIEGPRLACERKALESPEYRHVKDVREVVTDRFLCTGGSDPTLEDNTCYGDSGGSLFINMKRRFIQAGVVSWGSINVCTDFHHDRNNARDFHINLLKVQPWLRQMLHESLVFID